VTDLQAVGVVTGWGEGLAALPADAARAVIETRSHKAAVDADWEKSHAYGVTGVPTYVAGGHGVVGAQPYEALEALVKQARSAPRG